MKLVASLVALSLLTQTLSVYTNPDLQHVFVLYLENQSFDGLFGVLKGVNGVPANPQFPQVNKTGIVYPTLPCDNTVNCSNSWMIPNTTNAPFNAQTVFQYRNNPVMPYFSITHRYFQEQYQIDGGRMDKFAAWSTANGVVMAYLNMTQSYIGQLAQNWTICDQFFHSAFGGSYLNHQWLVSAQTPTFPATALNANNTNLLNITFDPTTGWINTSGGDNSLWFTNGSYWTVNTMESVNPPLNPRTPSYLRMPSINNTNIGDLLSAKNVSWKWYSGGYNLAMANNDTQGLFQYHHQPFVYYSRFANATGPERLAHIQDEVNLLQDLQAGTLPQVIFWKPYGIVNFHPQYSNLSLADVKLEEIVSAIQNSKYWANSAIIITFDENGGKWDHVAPPKGNIWGPGTRIPAIVVSPFIRQGYVDNTTLETISVIKFLQEFYNLSGNLIPANRNVTSIGQVLANAAPFIPSPASPLPPAATPQGVSPLVIAIPIAAVVLIIAVVVAVYAWNRCRKDDNTITGTIIHDPTKRPAQGYNTLVDQP